MDIFDTDSCWPSSSSHLGFLPFEPQPDPEHVAFGCESFDVIPTFRSMPASSSFERGVSGGSCLVESPYQTQYQEPSHFRGEFVLNHSEQLFTLSQQSKFSPSKYQAPPIPDYALGKNVFEVNDKLSVDEVLELVKNILDQQRSCGLSYEANLSKCEFTCVFVVGSKHCKFVVTVYDNSPKRENSFLVEAQKRNGDAAPFKSVFETIKNFCQATTLQESNSLRESFSQSLPIQSKSFWNEESLEGLIPILNMARSTIIETQLEGARLLCELSLDEDLQQYLGENGVVEILRDILMDGLGTEWAKQHAVLTLVNLCAQINCQDAIIKAGVLPLLLKLATDGPFHSAELRRLSVVILCKVSSERLKAERVVASLVRADLNEWMGTVDSLKDNNIKFHAKIARDCLLASF